GERWAGERDRLARTENEGGHTPNEHPGRRDAARRRCGGACPGARLSAASVVATRTQAIRRMAGGHIRAARCPAFALCCGAPAVTSRLVVCGDSFAQGPLRWPRQAFSSRVHSSSAWTTGPARLTQAAAGLGPRWPRQLRASARQPPAGPEVRSL